MSRRAERWRRAAWQGRGPGPTLLRGVLAVPSGLYRLAVAARNLGYDRGLLKTHPSPIPVVSVGNLTVGGTGKTPFTAWVARELADRGTRPAVVARGYGADEVALHRRWNPDVPMIVAPRRAAGVEEAAGAGATVAVLDDGFQHRAAARDLDIVLISAEQPFPGALLPRGPYREPPGALARADLVVITVKTADDRAVRRLAERIRNYRPNLTQAVVRLAPAGWVSASGEPVDAPRGDTLALSSVAEPATFADLVARVTGNEPSLMVFPDHHDYGPGDVARITDRARGRTLVTTEKDAVKLLEHDAALPDLRVLRLQVVPDAGSGARIAAVLDALTVGGEAAG